MSDLDKEEIEATRKMQSSAEKTADEMFEELGYKILIENNHYIQYEFEGIYMDNEIKFDLKGKTILKEYSTGESQEITMPELQAINKKCEELKWI